MMPKSFHLPTIARAGSSRPASSNSIAIKWDPSPEEYEPPPLPSTASRFKISALTIVAALRFRRMRLMKVRLLRGTPLSRLRSCVYVLISITRLRTTLPLRRARRRQYLLSLQRHPVLHSKYMLHAFRSYGRAIVFCHRVVQKLHEKHVQCFPLETALVTISEALNSKLDQAINAGKCKVLLEVFSSSILSHLVIMRVVRCLTLAQEQPKPPLLSY